MKFNGFLKEGTKFLEQLSQNNTKEWFETNRHIWEKTILAPNQAFIEEMGETLFILVPTIKAVPKVSGSLFKIYRDTRFSHDKTPMKSKIGLLFWQGGDHRMQSSSFYMHYSKESYFIASGIRAFKAPLLKTYRNYIKDEKHRIELHTILENLKHKGYSLPSPKYKRLPKEFHSDDKFVYLSLYDCMFSFKEFPLDDTFYSLKLLERAFNIYEDMYSLQQWVYRMTLTHNDKK